MQDHEHVHPHDHHAEHDHPDAVDDAALTYYQAMEVAVRELLIEKKILTADELRAAVELMDARSPALGARLVARAWVDPSFKELLLENASAACAELGLDIGSTKLVAVENTQHVHNVLVCTLCSCYPRMLLGFPPDWYKSKAYRSRVVREPRAVLQEFGTVIREDIELRVHDSTADMRYVVLPKRPENTEHLTEEELAMLVTRDCMIGVSVPRPSRQP